MQDDPIEALRRRRRATAIAEADRHVTLDPHDPENWGVDPDALYDMSREDSL